MTSTFVQPPSLQSETRVAVPTAVAAFHLSRAQQTLRIWAMRENGPLRPVRIHGRLAWPTADLRKLLGVAQ
ncbi:MAG: DNA-binding protein [Alcaligenaceae bacterium]|nr:MAG: DNA-binding protein [Alcaligenaceae bacterium]